MTTATTYRTVVTHARQAPLHNTFRYRTGSWLVDLDAIPTLPRGLRWLTKFDPKDHLGSERESLRRNVDALLATRGIDLTGGTVLMLANARSLGHAFNPISIHWCYAEGGTLVAVIAEVHNTYGDRHAYLLTPDADGHVDQSLDKAMYVSPFNPVDGKYRITVTPPGDRIAVAVTLTRPDQPPFVASVAGERRPSRSVLRAAAGSAATSLRVSTLIRWQGIRLFLRGLKVQPRAGVGRFRAASTGCSVMVISGRCLEGAEAWVRHAAGMGGGHRPSDDPLMSSVAADVKGGRGQTRPATGS